MSNYNNSDSDNSYSNGGPLARRPQSPAPLRQQFNPDLYRLQRSVMDSDEKHSRFNLQDYLGLLWRGKWIILACLILAGGLAAYYTYSLPYVYESSLQILVNEREGGIPLLNSETYWSSPDRVVKKELQILGSRPILQATAEELLQRRFLDSATRDTLIPLIYNTEKELQPVLANASEGERHDILVQRIVLSIQNMVTVSQSKDADIIQIKTRAGDPNEAALITNTYAEVYAFDNLQQNRAKAIKMKDFVEEKLQSTRDSLSEQEVDLKDYMEENSIIGPELQKTDLVAAKSRLEDDATRTQIEISTLQSKINEFERQLRAVDSAFVETISSASWAYISQMQQKIAELEVQKQIAETQDPVRKSEVWYQNNLKELDRQIDNLRRKLEPEVNKIKNSAFSEMPSTAKGDGEMRTTPLNRLKQQIFEDEIKLQALKAQYSALNAARAEVDRRIAIVPNQEMEMERLQREKTGLEKIYVQLNEEYNKKVLEEQSVFPTVRIFEPAQASLVPVGPKRTVNITIGSIVGLAIGIGIVLLIAYSDTTVHSPDDLEKNGFVVLTTIPLIPQELLAQDGSAARAEGAPGDVLSKVSPHLITHSRPKSPIAESYRSLRTAVQYASIEEPIRKILVASSVPQEGKSTTSANLAIVIAQSGSKTLLVDCDLRRPRQHAVFNTTREPGLVDCLVGNATLSDGIRPTEVPNLDILPSGSIPPNPSELIGSSRMRDVLHDLESRYDTIIIDSPPISAVTDAVILATLADTTVLVVRAHKTKMEFLEKSRESLERISMPLMGVVLNDFDVSQSYGSASYKYYRYYRYYNYYGTNPEDDTPGERMAKHTKAALKDHREPERQG